MRRMPRGRKTRKPKAQMLYPNRLRQYLSCHNDRDHPARCVKGGVGPFANPMISAADDRKVRLKLVTQIRTSNLGAI